MRLDGAAGFGSVRWVRAHLRRGYRGGSRRHQIRHLPRQDHQLPCRHVEPVRGRGLARHHGQVAVGVDQQAELARPSSPKASTQRSATPSGTSDRAGRRGTRRPASPRPPARCARRRDAGHPGVGHGGRQLQVAVVVDPGHLGPQAGSAVGQASLLDHPADEAAPARRGRPRRPARAATCPCTARPRPGRTGRARRRCRRGRPAAPGRCQLHRPADRPSRRPPRPRPPAGRCPGRRSSRVPPSGSPPRGPGPGASVPTPGSTTPSTTPGPRWGTARTKVWLPARTSKAGM